MNQIEDEIRKTQTRIEHYNNGIKSLRKLIEKRKDNISSFEDGVQSLNKSKKEAEDKLKVLLKRQNGVDC